MSAVLLPNGEQQFTLTRIDVDGQPYTVPNAGGFVYMYEPGSTVPQTTWLDAAQTTANTDPIRLDPNGRAIIYGVGQYRQLVTDASGNVVWDQLTELGIDTSLITEVIANSLVLVDGPNPGPPNNNPDQGTRALAAVLGSFVDARNGRFGNLRSGSDDLVVIQAAINYAASIGGATVYLGPGPLTTAAGTQLVWPSLASGVNLKGDGPQTTLLNINGNPSVDVFVLTAGNLAHCQIRDMGFNVAGTATGGALIRFANAYGALVENVRMANGFYNGIFVEGGSNQYLLEIDGVIAPATATANAAILIGSDTTGIAQGVYITNCKLAGSAFGVYARNASGLTVSDSEFLNHGQSGFITSPASVGGVKSVTLSNCFSDTCGQAGINIGHSGGQVQAVSIEGGSSNNSLNGIIIAPSANVANVSIVGVQLYVNKRSAVVNYGANNVLFTNNLCVGNGTAAANTYDALSFTDCEGCTINSNLVGAGFGFPAMHRYGIRLTGSADYCVVTSNTTGGPSGTGSLLVDATGTHNIVANNTGT
jgi:hypothetical protein